MILAPTPNDMFSPVLQLFAVKDNIRSVDVVSFDHIDISLAEFDLTLEEYLLFDLYHFSNSLSVKYGWGKKKTASFDSDKSANVIRSGEEPSLLTLLENHFNDTSKSNKIYIEQLFLGVVRLNLSYVKGKKGTYDSPPLAEWLSKDISDHLSYHRKGSAVFVDWSRQTSDEDRRAEGTNKETTECWYCWCYC